MNVRAHSNRLPALVAGVTLELARVTAILLLVACGRSSGRTELVNGHSFRTLSDSLLSAAGKLVCLEGQLVVRVGEPPSSRDVPAVPCSTTQRSPTIYAYRADGAAVVVGLEYEVEQKGIAVFADSLTQLLTTQHGPPAECPKVDDLGPHVIRHHYWHGSDYAIMLLASSFEAHPSVGIEIHAGAPGCSHWVGRPYDR